MVVFEIIDNHIFPYKADLAEDFRLANLAKRTRKEKYKIYAIRIVVNLIVLGLSALSAYLIYIATQVSIKVINNLISSDDLSNVGMNQP